MALQNACIHHTCCSGSWVAVLWAAAPRCPAAVRAACRRGTRRVSVARLGTGRRHGQGGGPSARHGQPDRDLASSTLSKKLKIDSLESMTMPICMRMISACKNEQLLKEDDEQVSCIYFLKVCMHVAISSKNTSEIRDSYLDTRWAICSSRSKI